MTESWRIKKHYEKRVLVDTPDILASTFPDVLLCLTGAQANMLRNMTQYLHRRSTFAQDKQTTYYLSPTNEDWDTISAMVADLEDKLMGCDMDLIVAAIEANTAAILAGNACLCAQKSSSDGLIEFADTWAPNLSDSLDIAALVVPSGSTEQCELANVIWGFVFQYIIETVLPVLDSAIDATAISIGLTSAFAIATAGIGLPVAAAAALLGVIVAMITDTVEENLVNWMIANADEMVCHLFNGLSVGSYKLAALNAQEHIEASGLPFGDIMMLKLFLTAEFFMQQMQQAIDLGYLSPDQYTDYPCGDCLEDEYQYLWEGVPCPGGNLVGTNCADGYPQISVGNTIETAEPFVAFVAESTIYRLSVVAFGNGVLGGTIDCVMKRTNDDIPLETWRFTVPASTSPVLYTHDFGTSPTVTVYFYFQPVGASVCQMFYAGLDVL